MSLSCRSLRHPAQSALFRDITINLDSFTHEGLCRLRAQLAQLDRLGIRCRRLSMGGSSSRASRELYNGYTTHRKSSICKSTRLLIATLLHWKGGPVIVEVGRMQQNMIGVLLDELEDWPLGPVLLVLEEPRRLNDLLELDLPGLVPRWQRCRRVVLETRYDHVEAIALQPEADGTLNEMHWWDMRRRQLSGTNPLAALPSLEVKLVETWDWPLADSVAASSYLSVDVLANCAALAISRHHLASVYQAYATFSAPRSGWPLRSLTVQGFEHDEEDGYPGLPERCWKSLRRLPEQIDLLRLLPYVQRVDFPASDCSASGDQHMGFPFHDLPRSLLSITLRASSSESGGTFDLSLIALKKWLLNLAHCGVGALESFRFHIDWFGIHESLEEEAPWAWTDVDYEELQREHPELCKRYPWDDDCSLYEEEFLDVQLNRLHIEKWRAQMEAEFREIKQLLDALPIRYQVDMPTWDKKLFEME